MDDVGEVFVRGQIIGGDRGSCAKVTVRQIDAAAAGGARRLEAQIEPGECVELDACARRIARLIGDRIEIQLHVGPQGLRVGAHETAEVIDAQAHGTAAGQQISNARQHAPRVGMQFVVESPAGRLERIDDREMILQIPADRRIVEHGFDTVLAEQRARANT